MKAEKIYEVTKQWVQDSTKGMFVKGKPLSSFYEYDDSYFEITTEMGKIPNIGSGKQIYSCYDEVLTLKTIIDLRINPASYQRVMEFITRVNSDILFGKFNFNLDNGEISFGLYQYVQDEGSLTDNLIGKFTVTGKFMFEHYGAGLLYVINGKTPVEAIQEIRNTEEDSCSCGCDH